VMDVYASVVPGRDIGSVVAAVEELLEASPEIRAKASESTRGTQYEVTGPEFAGKGYSYTLTGEVATMRKSFDQFLEGFLLAVILVYLVLVIQFRSFTDPFIVLLAVPLGLIGIAASLFLTGTHFSIMAAMGVIMTVGLVVAYSILLVDFANRRLAEGGTAEAAVSDATRVRFRPILMTSLSTIVALTPMAIGGAGAEANAPLARAIIGGVLSAAVLSMIVVPCIYVVFKRPTDRRDSAAEAAEAAVV